MSELLGKWRIPGAKSIDGHRSLFLGTLSVRKEVERYSHQFKQDYMSRSSIRKARVTISLVPGVMSLCHGIRAGLGMAEKGILELEQQQPTFMRCCLCPSCGCALCRDSLP